MSFFRKLFSSLILLFFFLNNAQAGSPSCVNRVEELNKQKEIILERGGTWSLFEKFPKLRSNSKTGLRLDQEINQLINLSNYICETIDGVPLNDLAIYVLGSVDEMGEMKFRDQLRIFGKPDKEVEDWFRYAQLAVRFEKRLLNPDKVEISLAQSAKLLGMYNDLTINTVNTNLLLDQTLRLIGKIQKFLENDSNMSQALFEKEQEPYWDIDENYGGS